MNKAPKAFTYRLSNSNSSPIVTTATPPTQLPHFHSLAPFEFTPCFQHLPNNYLRPLLHLKPTFLPPLHHSNTSTTLGLLDLSLLPFAFLLHTSTPSVTPSLPYIATPSNIVHITGPHHQHLEVRSGSDTSTPLITSSKIFYSGHHQV